MLTAPELKTFELDGERFVRPDFDGRGLANVAPSVIRLLAPHASMDLPPLDAEVLPEALTHGVRRIVLLVADGFGHLQLEREVAAGNAPNLARLLDRAADPRDELVVYNALTSVFP